MRYNIRGTVLQAWCYDQTVALEVAQRLSLRLPEEVFTVKAGTRLLASYHNGSVAGLLEEALA